MTNQTHVFPDATERRAARRRLLATATTDETARLAPKPPFRVYPHSDEAVSLWIAAFERSLAAAAEDSGQEPDVIAYDIAHYSLIEPPEGFDAWDVTTETVARAALT